MLSVGAMGAGQGNYYVGLAREDYYLEGGEPLGHWWGDGARVLELTGAVEKDALQNLLRGVSPEGQILVQNSGAKERQPGWDLTFSAPKSVSVLWGIADDVTRQTLQEIQCQAVTAALQYLQEEASTTRRGKGGHTREAAGLVIATFEHGTSRAQDPQLHTHALVLNVGIRRDGTTGAILSKPLYQHKMTAGALYRAELGLLLEQRLGWRLQPSHHAFEVQGLPAKLLAEFSKRRAAIEQHMSERGTTGAYAAAVATLATREVKAHTARAHLFPRWREVAAAHGIQPQIAQELRREPVARNPERLYQQALGSALETITNQSSTFGKKDVLRHMAEQLQTCGVGAKGIRHFVNGTLTTSPDIVCLGRIQEEIRFTTREMLATEKRLLQIAQASRNDQSHVIAEKALQASMRQHPNLNDEQRQSMDHLTRSAGSIQVLSGMAGTGKTQTLAAACKAWEAAGYQVFGAALAGKAAQGLQEGSGIQSETLTKRLMDLRSGVLDAAQHHGKQLLRAAVGKPTSSYEPFRLSAKSVLVVDEAGMLGTRLMTEIVERVRNAGAKLILVGDARQLPPIEAGGPFKALGQLLGQSELQVIQRQRNLWARDAVRDFAEGKAQEALRAYAERGFLTVSETRHEAMESIVRDWRADQRLKPQERLILTSTNNEARALNERIQASRKEAGELGVLWLAENGERFYSGDRVLFGQNFKLYGVSNGTLATIESINVLDRALTVTLDNKERRTIPLNRYKDVALGYAVTTHKAQGVTTENAYVLIGGSNQNREITYVQASRARGDTRFYTERAEVGETLAQLSDQMQKSRQKELAIVSVLDDTEHIAAQSLPRRQLGDVLLPRMLEPGHEQERRPEKDRGPSIGY